MFKTLLWYPWKLEQTDNLPTLLQAVEESQGETELGCVSDVPAVYWDTHKAWSILTLAWNPMVFGEILRNRSVMESGLYQWDHDILIKSWTGLVSVWRSSKKKFPAFLTMNSPWIPKQSFDIVLHKRLQRVDQSNAVDWDLLRGDLKIKATGKTLGLRQWGEGFIGAGVLA